jgi:NAD(P)-dependent dehydrogenase (short-subunit alcohol dehydrogenase family)
MSERSLKGKVALVTGASRGIGRAAAVELAELGAAVVVTARTVTPRDDDLSGTIRETADAITAAGAEALAIGADLGQPGEGQRIVDEALATFGRIDILVNNAADTGDNVFRGFWETDAGAWSAQIALNLNAMYALMRACAPSMRDNGGGLIVNLGSMREMPEGINGMGGRITEDVRLGAAYPTSKIAAFTMSTMVGNELAEHGIAVITMNPGGAATESFVHNAKRFGWDPAMGTPVWMPAKTIGFLATCDDPMAYAATFVDAVDFAEEHKLAPGVDR